MTSFKSEEKLSEVLELFLLPNYNVVSTSYLDLLLTHISDQVKESNKNDYKHCKLLQKWVLEALDAWSADCKPSQPVRVFTLKLVGIISCNELHFHYWQCKNVYSRLCDLLQLHSDDLPAPIKMAYTLMLSNLVKHRSGREWIIESGAWKDIVQFAHWNHTMYVTRESHKFLWLLLLHEHQNTDFCKEVISVISAPLTSNAFEPQVYQVSEDNYLEQNKLLCTTLDLLTSIVENTLFENMDNKISELCQEVIDLDSRVKALFETCVSTRLFPHVRKLLVLRLFIPIKHCLREGQVIIDDEVPPKFCYELCYMSMLLLDKKYVVELVKVNMLLLIYWKRLQSVQKFAFPHEHKFEHQAISIIVMPLAMCIKHSYINHDLFDMFITKMFDVTCTAIQRLAYNVRDTIHKNDLPLAQIAKVCIDMILEITDIMDRDIAVITFQTLCHVLKNFVPNICNETMNIAVTNNVMNSEVGPKKHVFMSPLEGDPMTEHPKLLAALLNGLAVMTEKFKLKWQECVETICLLYLAQEILNDPGIVCTVAVNALKICKLAIRNFMPPNLVLLVETASNMNEIGTTLFRRLHDVNWEVRDSVLEVLNTIAIISEDKYPAFQEFLLAKPFLQVAVQIAKSDSESYVRASALTFVSNTVRIYKLWERKLSQLNLPEFVIHLLDTESEAIVRKEAVVLITELYVHCKWSKNVIDSMSQAMTTAAVFDLHWEVKKNALEYWKQFIKSHLSDQGVLDGHFPKVTFSKEHRKIVSLNESEIKRRLNKALDELSKQNCLGVLLVTLEDDSDFEVCKTSATILSTLKVFLLKYKLNEPLPELPLPKDSATLDASYIKRESVNGPMNSNSEGICSNSNNVIEEIVDANDANLLASIYKQSMKMDEETQKTDEKTFKFISCVTRQVFLQTIFNSNIDAYIQEKSRWLTTYTTSFESVLDDILTMHERGDTNSMDCY